MLRFILLSLVLAGLAWSAPTSVPVAIPKSLALVTDLKTPASTTKLAPLVAPVGTPVFAPLSRLAYAPVLPQLSPYAYSVPIAEIPSSYSIEQHGYHITY
ncbi:uncharacterized protein [Linepithema humile]|uniref:uncharacterized protein isoform X2 n=1 Tax=Linepithema humile TaxID=83485 RepID=UPI0006230097|nr:PREDICTED: uncharacterized protein LOC105669796 [Linepithema humile]